ncbi:MAG: flippase [candidate division KSB1 bacterium]|nr:flippase [candidate division KSB1 bacterium]
MPTRWGQRVLGNATALWSGQVWYFVNMVVWTALVARYIGPRVYGVYAYAQATVSMLLILVNLGLDQLIIRDLAQRADMGFVYCRHALRLKLALGILVLGGFVVLNLVQNQASETIAITAIVALYGIVGAVAQVFTAMINAREAMYYSVLAQSVNASLTLASGAVAVWMHLPFSVILLFSLVASCVQVMIGRHFALMLYRDVQKESGKEPTIWRAAIMLALRSIPFGILGVIAVLGTNLGVILLGWFRASDETIGYFGAALRVYSLVMLFLGALGDALFPGLARIYAESQERFAKVFEFSWRIFFFVSIPIVAGLWLVARDVLLLIYGSEFEDGVGPLRILSLMFLNGVGYLMGRAMAAMHRQTLSAAIQGAALVIVVCTACLAIPRYSANGVAGAMVGGTLAGLVVYTALLFRWLRLRFPVVWCIKTVIAAVVMGLGTVLVQSRIDALPVTLTIAPTIYLLTHLALRTVSRDEWAQAAKLLPGRLTQWIAAKWARGVR